MLRVQVFPERSNRTDRDQVAHAQRLECPDIGSLRENLHPQHMLLPDQYIDLTKSRSSTFFGDGAVAHVSMADPVCTNLISVIAQAELTFVSRGRNSQAAPSHAGIALWGLM